MFQNKFTFVGYKMLKLLILKYDVISKYKKLFFNFFKNDITLCFNCHTIIYDYLIKFYLNLIPSID